MSVDWSSPTWGQPGSNIHLGTTVADAHDASEWRAEETRG